MYQAYPYPSPTVGDSLIEDVANGIYSLIGDHDLEGKVILDAGCGTGHRLVAIARRYPRARFVGVDMTCASLDVARALAGKHRLRNIEFHEADLVEFAPPDRFDVIVSAGVIHHLENPARGLIGLASLLAKDGLMAVWLYHSLGEHQRLLDRETVLTLWDRKSGLDQGLLLMTELGLRLEAKRYGSSAAQASSEISQESIDVDAYLHPIVNAYRFGQALAMLREAGLDWGAINSINLLDRSRLIDLASCEHGDMRDFCQTAEELFDSDVLRRRVRELTPAEKLRVIEIELKPTGFTVVGGRGDSRNLLVPRAAGNVVLL
jgi:SAM-dependent methyltransferase